jgi:hypothetical protein
MERTDAAVGVGVSRPLVRTDRLRLAPSATRALGPELLVNAGGATQPVHRLRGGGPALWRCFEEGLTLGEAAEQLAHETGTGPADLEPHVLRFATSLIEARLAELDS